MKTGKIRAFIENARLEPTDRVADEALEELTDLETDRALIRRFGRSWAEREKATEAGTYEGSTAQRNYRIRREQLKARARELQ